MYPEDSPGYDEIETIYKNIMEPNEKSGNCLCVNCCVDVEDGDLNDIAAAKKKQLADAVEQLRIAATAGAFMCDMCERYIPGDDSNWHINGHGSVELCSYCFNEMSVTPGYEMPTE
jgi:hypothetical protein